MPICVNTRERAIDYIEARIIRIPIAGCWLWTIGVDGFGYGQTQTNYRHETAHRLAWRTYRGEIPERSHVLHRCDVPCCCNPDHLFLGTARDNIDDMLAKKRSLKGERHSMVKLTEIQVRQILVSNESLTELGRKYGCTLQNIWRIRKRQTWRHIE